ncbi:MAG: SHOCT domain-containing protein, partial [Oscillospiraceae bacterium]|nr:SHOCT domain-containing protein [Oscillospiraceae bacterium]
NIFLKIYNYIAQKCYLELYADELVGVNAKLFSRKTLKLPIERVDNISIEHTIMNKIIGGPTVVICSSSGKIKFNWVQNAQEFMDKVFETINQYKTSVASNLTKSEISLNTQNDDSIEKIIKLKNLLDQGVITQEEFEAQKKKFFQEI